MVRGWSITQGSMIVCVSIFYSPVYCHASDAGEIWWKLLMAVILQLSGLNDQIHGEQVTVPCITLSIGPKRSPSFALLLRYSRDSRVLLVIQTGVIALEQATVRISTIMVKRPSLNYRTEYSLWSRSPRTISTRKRASVSQRAPWRERTHDSS